MIFGKRWAETAERIREALRQGGDIRALRRFFAVLSMAAYRALEGERGLIALASMTGSVPAAVVKSEEEESAYLSELLKLRDRAWRAAMDEYPPEYRQVNPAYTDEMCFKEIGEEADRGAFMVDSGNSKHIRLPGRNVGARSTIEWLNKHGKKYAGKWVAIEHGALVDSDESQTTLYARIKESGRSMRDIFFAFMEPQ